MDMPKVLRIAKCQMTCHKKDQNDGLLVKQTGRFSQSVPYVSLSHDLCNGKTRGLPDRLLSSLRCMH